MRAYVIFSQEKYQALRMGNAYQVEQAQSNLNPSDVIIIKIHCQQKFLYISIGKQHHKEKLFRVSV